MCRTYNTIGCLTALKTHLQANNIHDFKSLGEVIEFQKTYDIRRNQLISIHKEMIESERNLLCIEMPQLVNTIESTKLKISQRANEEIENLRKRLISLDPKPNNIYQRVSRFYWKWRYNKEIKNCKRKFESELQRSIKDLNGIYQLKNERFKFLSYRFDEAVKESVHHPLLELDRKKKNIDELNNLIYGALGEQKVVKVLETLPDDYYLINDLSVSFSPAIYNRQENEYIRSIQIDHILVGPSGVFLIETKNWSERSLNNLSLRSPVQQIRRTSFVLFKLLNNEMSNSYLGLNGHHWGDKKIAIRNLIVLTNSKPKEEFQFVKVLTLNELPGYINYFKPIFSNSETQKIAEFLAEIGNQKTIVTK